jgi:hypothetical protein
MMNGRKNSIRKRKSRTGRTKLLVKLLGRILSKAKEPQRQKAQQQQMLQSQLRKQLMMNGRKNSIRKRKSRTGRTKLLVKLLGRILSKARNLKNRWSHFE